MWKWLVNNVLPGVLTSFSVSVPAMVVHHVKLKNKIHRKLDEVQEQTDRKLARIHRAVVEEEASE